MKRGLLENKGDLIRVKKGLLFWAFQRIDKRKMRGRNLVAERIKNRGPNFLWLFLYFFRKFHYKNKLLTLIRSQYFSGIQFSNLFFSFQDS